MKPFWARFGVHADWLTQEVSRRVQNDLWRASLHVANDDTTRDCPTCAWPHRAIAAAEAIGRGLATLLAAFRFRDRVQMQRAVELLPSNLDEGHVLLLNVIKRSFLRCADDLGLPPSDTRHITKAIQKLEHIERGSVQLCFDFARAA